MCDVRIWNLKVLLWSSVVFFTKVAEMLIEIIFFIVKFAPEHKCLWPLHDTFRNMTVLFPLAHFAHLSLEELFSIKKLQWSYKLSNVGSTAGLVSIFVPRGILRKSSLMASSNELIHELCASVSSLKGNLAEFRKSCFLSGFRVICKLDCIRMIANLISKTFAK